MVVEAHGVVGKTSSSQLGEKLFLDLYNRNKYSITSIRSNGKKPVQIRYLFYDVISKNEIVKGCCILLFAKPCFVQNAVDMLAYETKLLFVKVLES